MKRLFFLFFLLALTAPLHAQWQRGEGEFEYTLYAPLADKPIVVRYYIPSKGDIAQMRVLMAMHGADRDAASVIGTWRYFAEEDGFVVIAPEFTHKNGYLENDYQFGGVFTDATFTRLNPPEKWTYNTIEAIFDDFRAKTGSAAAQYDLWGHSAGGQFTHRMVLAMPAARIRLAVASNPGSWTFPLADGIKDKDGNAYGWPYSVKGSPFATEEHIKGFLAAPLVVHLGNADLATSGSSVPTDAGALAEGATRFDRGRAFFKSGRQVAKTLKVPCAWRQVEVDDVGHAGRSIVYGKSRTVDSQRVFSTDYITPTGAYSVIFRGK